MCMSEHRNFSTNCYFYGVQKVTFLRLININREFIIHTNNESSGSLEVFIHAVIRNSLQL